MDNGLRSSKDLSIAELDLSQIKITGPVLNVGKTGQKCIFYLSGAPTSVLADGITFSVDGPTKPNVNKCEYEAEDESLECYFVALEPGEYELTIRYRKQVICESPSKIKITGDSISAAELISKVNIYGKASILGKALTTNEFIVDSRSDYDLGSVIGPLKVNINGPKKSGAHVDIEDNKNGTYNVLYKPTSPGMYTMDIKIAGQHIPNSPLIIKVIELRST